MFDGARNSQPVKSYIILNGTDLWFGLLQCSALSGKGMHDKSNKRLYFVKLESSLATWLQEQHGLEFVVSPTTHKVGEAKTILRVGTLSPS